MGSLQVAPESEATNATADVDRAIRDVLLLPSGTTLRVLLLAAMVGLSAVYVGIWVSVRATTGPPASPPLAWLVLPPVTVLGVALSATWLAPRWLELRHGWRPVPPDRGAAALTRFDELVAEAGLRRKPLLVWNPREEHDRALTYGRPGLYRVALSPTLLSAARRRPAIFDSVVRHELAHVRHGDATSAYFVIIIWYAFLVMLGVSFLWRAVERALLLDPDYLVRVGILGLAVYWVRADLLRRRERYADLRAADTVAHRQALVTTLAFRRDDTSPRRRLALHPTADVRVAVIRDPRHLGRLMPVEVFAVGFTATWGAPLLTIALSGGTGALTAERVTKLILLALVGAYLGAALVRRAGCGIANGKRDLVRAAGGLLLGLTVGTAVSVGRTGMLSYFTNQIAADAVTGTVLVGYFLWSADMAWRLPTDSAAAGRARLSRSAIIIASGAVFGLAGASASSVSTYVLGGDIGSLAQTHIFALGSSASAPMFVAIVPLLGVVVLLRPAVARWSLVLTTLVAGLGFAVVGTLTILLVRQGVDLTAGPGPVWRYYFYAALWIAVAAAVLAAVLVASAGGAGRLISGVTAAGITAVGVGVGHALLENMAYSRDLQVPAVLTFARYAGCAAILIAPVVAGIVWLANAPLSRLLHWRGARAVAATVVVVTAVAATISVVPSVVNEGPARAERAAGRAELRGFLEHEVQSVGQQRVIASSKLNQALALPPAQAAGRIRRSVLIRYDAMLAEVDDHELVHSPARKVRRDLRAALSAERDLIRTRGDVLDGSVERRRYTEAVDEFDRALETWEVTWRAAVAEVEE